MRTSAVRQRKKPKAIALINQDACSGCEVCVYFCPVEGCIIKTAGPQYSELTGVCEVIPELCIGCGLCVRECPWKTIQMVPIDSGTASGVKLSETVSAPQRGTP